MMIRRLDRTIADSTGPPLLSTDIMVQCILPFFSNDRNMWIEVALINNDIWSLMQDIIPPWPEVEIPIAGRHTSVVTFSPDNITLAYGQAKYIVLLDRRNLQRRVLEAFPSNHTVFSLSFSPDGTKIAAGSGRGWVGIWNLEDVATNRMFEFDGHVHTVVDTVTFSPDGLLLAATCPNHRKASIWRVDDGTRIASWNYSFLSFAPDGEHLAKARLVDDGGLIEIYKMPDLITPETVRAIPSDEGKSTAIAYSPQGRYLASASLLPNIGHDGPRFFCRVKLWDIVDDKVRVLPHEFDSKKVQFLPNYEAIQRDLSSSVQAWGWACHIAFSPDSQTLAVADSNATISTWNVPDNRLVAVETKGRRHRSVSFSPDGFFFALGYESRDGFFAIQIRRTLSTK